MSANSIKLHACAKYHTIRILDIALLSKLTNPWTNMTTSKQIKKLLIRLSPLKTKKGTKVLQKSPEALAIFRGVECKESIVNYGKL